MYLYNNKSKKITKVQREWIQKLISILDPSTKSTASIGHSPIPMSLVVPRDW